MINLLIADDHALMRDGLSTILSDEADINIVGTARTGEEALELALKLKPGLILMDVQMPGMGGIASARAIKSQLPATIVLMLTTYVEDDYIIEALASGADGFLLKDMPGDKLLQAVRDAAAGQLMLPASVAAKLAARLSSAITIGHLQLETIVRKAESAAFTDRELEIARCMAKGISNREIAETVFMSEGTVKNYVSSIYMKIGTNERTVAAIALNHLFQQIPPK